MICPAVVMSHRGNNHLQPLLGVAWDCGAVTTGPVTVPVLLSLGVGVMDAQRQKRAAQAVLEDAALKKSEGMLLAIQVGSGGYWRTGNTSMLSAGHVMCVTCVLD
jgi:hypothetical protein